MFRAWFVVCFFVVLSPLAEVAGQTAPPQMYWLADSTGKRWESTDPAWLHKWVAQRNAALANPRVTPPVDNYGLNPEMFPKVESGHSKIMGDGPALSDHPGKPDVFLNVFGDGSEDVIKRWEADPGFAEMERKMGGRLAMKAYPKDYPTNLGLKLEDGGLPDVLIQFADGREAKRWYSDPGATAVVGEVREIDPEYKPGGDAPGTSFFDSFAGKAIVGVCVFSFATMAALSAAFFLHLAYRKLFA